MSKDDLMISEYYRRCPEIFEDYERYVVQLRDKQATHLRLTCNSRAREKLVRTFSLTCRLDYQPFGKMSPRSSPFSGRNEDRTRESGGNVINRYVHVHCKHFLQHIILMLFIANKVKKACMAIQYHLVAPTVYTVH